MITRIIKETPHKDRAGRCAADFFVIPKVGTHCAKISREYSAGGMIGADARRVPAFGFKKFLCNMAKKAQAFGKACL